MRRPHKKLVATLTLASFTQVACYNSYFIDKTELEKLESTVEPQEVVEVYGDCPAGATTASVFEMGGPVYAQAEGEEEEPGESVDDEVMSEIEDITGDEEETATDATSTGEEEKTAETGEAKADTDTKTKKKSKKTKKDAPMPANRQGCTRVEVSTANALQVVTNEGKARVTPFNFIMSGGQLVSPEYDLLVPLKQVEGARVREFSTFKTVGMILGVSAVAIGTFVGISLLAEPAGGFQPN